MTDEINDEIKEFYDDAFHQMKVLLDDAAKDIANDLRSEGDLPEDENDIRAELEIDKANLLDELETKYLRSA